MTASPVRLVGRRSSLLNLVEMMRARPANFLSPTGSTSIELCAPARLPCSATSSSRASEATTGSEASREPPRPRLHLAPFEPGHELSARHGAYSPRKVDPLAEELVQQALELTSYLAEPSYRPALYAWARAEARVQLLEEYLADHGQLDDQGKPRPATDLLERLERRAGALRNELGMTPLSRARLGRDVAAQHIDLACLWADDTNEEKAP